LRGSQDPVHEGRANQVLDRALVLIRGSDEELVLDVYEVLGSRDYFDIRIGNGVLSGQKMPPT
jgi:hypothetical protein